MNVFEVKDYIMVLKYVYSKRRTAIGFLVWFLIITAVMIVFPVGTLDSISFRFRVIIFILFSLISFLYWLYLSGRCLKRSKKLKIGIALRSKDSKAQLIIDDTFQRLSDELDRLDLSDEFHIYYIGYDVIKDNKSAQKYVRKWKLNLLIHGTVYNGLSDSKYRCDLKDSRFTINPDDICYDAPIKIQIEEQINFILNHRNWIIEENNSHNDIDKITHSFVEIILSMISLSLCGSVKHPEISIKILNKLIPYIESQIPIKERKIEINKNEKKISMPINLLRSGILNSTLLKCYVNAGSTYISLGNYIKACEVYNEALKRGANKFYCYMSLAFCSFFMNKLSEAENYTSKMNDEKKNSIEYYLNLGFFAILKKDYKNAIISYENVRKCFKDSDKITIDSVITFLYDRLIDNKNEYAYFYAIGVLSYMMDKATGRKRLNAFLDHASNAAYIDMVKKAKQILKIKDK